MNGTYRWTTLQVRFLVLVPPPQFLLHSDHGPHEPQLVFGGHLSKLQNKTIVEAPGHGLFLSFSSRRLLFRPFLKPFRFLLKPYSMFSVGTWHVRDLCLVPPPQVKLHFDQSPIVEKSPKLYSIYFIIIKRVNRE